LGCHFSGLVGADCVGEVGAGAWRALCPGLPEEASWGRDAGGGEVAAGDAFNKQRSS
jgi:hypothetical protein